MTIRRLLALVLLAMGMVVALAGPASAHARLVNSDPAASAVLTAAPTELVLRFDEEVNGALGSVVLLDESGSKVAELDLKGVDGQPEAVRAELPKLDSGVYVAEWRVTSADSHPVTGAIPFRIGEGAAPTTESIGVAPKDSSGLSFAMGVTRWFTYVGLALLIGGAAFVVIAWPAGTGWWPARRIAWFGWGLTLAAALGAFALQGPYAAGLSAGKALDPDIWREVAQTRFGQAQLLRVGLLLLALPLLGTLLRGVTRVWVVLGSLVALALAGSVALAGHAGTGRLPILGLVAGTGHTAAMALWLGGLVVLGFVALVPPVPKAAGAAVRGDESAVPVAGDAEATEPADALEAAQPILASEGGDQPPSSPAGADELLPAVQRFSSAALVAVAVIAVTGVFQAWRMVGGPAEVPDSRWGRTLLVKLGLVAVLLVLAWVSRRVVRRQWPAVGSLRRTVLAEVAVGALVLVASVVLVQTSPQADAPPRLPFNASLVQGNVIADVTVSPAAVGESEMHLLATVPGGSLQRAQAEARLSLPSRELGPIPVELQDEGPNHWSAAVELPYKGDWTLEVLVTTADGSLVRLSTPMTVTG